MERFGIGQVYVLASTTKAAVAPSPMEADDGAADFQNAVLVAAGTSPVPQRTA